MSRHFFSKALQLVYERMCAFSFRSKFFPNLALTVISACLRGASKTVPTLIHKLQRFRKKLRAAYTGT